MESLRLYTPLPAQLKAHQTDSRRRLIRGSNRAGKTLCGAAELAWAVTGTHPWIKYPKENGRAWIVAQGMKELGQVIWRKLTSSPFRIIRDEHTHAWRVVQPWNEFDLAYREKWKDAPPLLPDRFIKGEPSWYSKKENQPAFVKLINGWELSFWSSDGQPRRGSDIDCYWLDEEIINSNWCPELLARVIDRAGRGWWTATPQSATQEMLEWYLAAIAPDNDRTSISEHFLHLAANPYMTDADKEEFKKSLRSTQERATRWEGEFAILGLKVYPEFDMQVHGCDPFPIPNTWTRYMVVDPGRQVCAVLFVAIPPPDDTEGGTIHFYDELYIKQCSAKIFGEEVSRKMGDYRRGVFETFIIDMQGAQVGDVGSGIPVIDQYAAALQSHGVWSRNTGSSFVPGTKDIKGRETALRMLMENDVIQNRPKLCVHREKLPCLEFEMPHQFYKKDKSSGMPTDKRVDAHDHLVSCAEYLAAFRPYYRKPEAPRDKETMIEKVMKKFEQWERQDSRPKGITLGPR